MADVEGVVREIGMGEEDQGSENLDRSQIINERYLTVAEDAKKSLHVAALIEQGEK